MSRKHTSLRRKNARPQGYGLPQHGSMNERCRNTAAKAASTASANGANWQSAFEDAYWRLRERDQARYDALREAHLGTDRSIAECDLCFLVDIIESLFEARAIGNPVLAGIRARRARQKIYG